MRHARFLRQFGTNSVSSLYLTAKAFYALSKNVLGSALCGGGPDANRIPECPKTKRNGITR